MTDENPPIESDGDIPEAENRPTTIEDRLEGHGIIEAVVPALEEAVNAKVAEAMAILPTTGSYPFAVDNHLDANIIPVLCFGIGRNGNPGHWFEYRKVEVPATE